MPDPTDTIAEIMRATVRAIGGTGARELEIGTPDPGDACWATATFRGSKVICDGQPDPLSAVLGLYAMLAAGGSCTACGKRVAMYLSVKDMWIDAARMHEGKFQTRAIGEPLATYCKRALERDPWRWQGCL